MNGGTAPDPSFKARIKRIPLIGPSAATLSRLPIFARARRYAFPGSARFWDTLYREGGTSGPGSYGRLARFKAEILNDFVQKNGIQTVIEFGCGDGAQLLLARYPKYVGVDVARGSIERCSALFATDATKRFYLFSKLPQDIGTFDLALSLDVIYHLVEDAVFESYMKRLLDSSHRHVAIYASNYDATTPATHVRHRKFTTWIEKNAPEWQKAAFIPNRFPFDPKKPDETSHADFYFFARSAPSESSVFRSTKNNAEGRSF